MYYTRMQLIRLMVNIAHVMLPKTENFVGDEFAYLSEIMKDRCRTIRKYGPDYRFGDL